MTRPPLARAASAVLIGVALLAGTGYLAGFRIAAVTSGSMSPAIRTGDAVVIRTGATATTGDIVTFRAGATGHLVTHRVVAVTTVAGQRTLTTRGDANTNSDPAAVRPAQVYGTVVLRVPAVGRTLAAAGTGPGRLALGAVLALILLPELLAVAGVRHWRDFRRSPGRHALGRVE